MKCEGEVPSRQRRGTNLLESGRVELVKLQLSDQRLDFGRLGVGVRRGLDSVERDERQSAKPLCVHSFDELGGRRVRVDDNVEEPKEEGGKRCTFGQVGVWG